MLRFVLISLVLGSCQLVKKTKSDVDASADARLPESWDGASDWKDGSWSVESVR